MRFARYVYRNRRYVLPIVGFASLFPSACRRASMPDLLSCVLNRHSRAGGNPERGMLGNLFSDKFMYGQVWIPACAGMTGTGIKCRGRLKIFSDGLLVCFIAMHCFNQQCTSVPSFSPVTTRLSEPCLAMPKTTMLILRSRQRAKAVASMTLRFLFRASSKVMVS